MRWGSRGSSVSSRTRECSATRSPTRASSSMLPAGSAPARTSSSTSGTPGWRTSKAPSASEPRPSGSPRRAVPTCPPAWSPAGPRTRSVRRCAASAYRHDLDMKTTRIGFLGAGNLAGALIAGLLGSKVVGNDQIQVADPRSARLDELRAAHGVEGHATNADVVKWANVVVLSVKPQVLPQVLAECGALIGSAHLVVSVVAGVPIRAVESKVGPGARVVRAMPNTAALARAGATAIAGSASATAADVDVARALFDAVGRTVVLDEA